MKTIVLECEGIDHMLDLIQPLIADPKRRQRQMTAAMEAGLVPCECCGKGLTTLEAAVVVTGPADEILGCLGPECGRRVLGAL